MGKPKSYSAAPTHLITKWTTGVKRKTEGKRLSSPSNETASPDKKNQKSAEDVERTPNEPEPKILTPERDKTKTASMEIDEVKPQATENKRNVSAPTSEEPSETLVKPQAPGMNKSEETREIFKSPINNIPKETAAKEIESTKVQEGTSKKDTPVPEETKVTSAAERKQGVLPSMKTSYLQTAKTGKPFPSPLLPQWKAHRIACLFEIDQPDNKSDRTQILSMELNKMLNTVREYVDKCFVRKYKEHYTPRDKERPSWISKFDKKRASDLSLFTFGFYAFQEPRGGMHRLLLQLVVPVATDIADLIMNVNNHIWSRKKNRRIMDIKEQNLHSPKNIGWLFRSNYIMASSTELQQEFEKRGGIHFGLTFKTVPVTYGKYNKDTAVKAICILTNEEDKEMAWQLLMRWYNQKKPDLPLGIPMKFVPSKEHPDICNNPTATKNISILLERQRIFLDDTDCVQCTALSNPEDLLPGHKKRTLRQELMSVTATTMGEELLGAKLFHAISKRVSPDNSTSYYFTFHKALEREALSIICGLGPFLKKELKLNPDDYCFPHAIDPSHKWNAKTRSVSNDTTSYLARLAIGEMGDTQINDGEYQMSDKNKRESRRIMGFNDDETVKDVTKPKLKMAQVPTEIRDDATAVSTLSGLTNYSTSTAASRERKNLRLQVTDQQEELEEKDAEIALLKKALQTQKERMEQGKARSPPNSADASQESSGENTAESKEIPDGWDPVIEIDSDDSAACRYGNPFGKSNRPHEIITEDELVDEKQCPEKEPCEADYYDADGNEISVLQDKNDQSDGLRFVTRGAPKEIESFQKKYNEDKVRTIISEPFHLDDPEETWVELFEVVDVDKFHKAYNENSPVRETLVRWSENVKLQEYDPETGNFFSSQKEVEEDNSDISLTQDDQSRVTESADDSSGSSSNSSAGSSTDEITHDVPSTEKPVSSPRMSSITKDILDTAEHTTHLPESSDTTGSGKEDV